MLANNRLTFLHCIYPAHSISLHTAKVPQMTQWIILLLLESQTDVLSPPSKFLFCIFVTFPAGAQTAGELQSPRIAMIQIISLLCIFHPPAHPNWLSSYIQITGSAEEQTFLQRHTQQGLTEAAACSCSKCLCLQHNKHCKLPLLYHCLLFPLALPIQVFGEA